MEVGCTSEIMTTSVTENPPEAQPSRLAGEFLADMAAEL
jgi:hypothetical protein